MKRIFGIMTIAVIAAFFTSCEESGKDTIRTKVSVVAGEATQSTITATITSSDADAVAWLCVENGKVLPTDVEIMSKGRGVEANKSVEITVTGLLPSTAYDVVAAAMKDDKIVVSAPVTITTSERIPEPAVTLAAEATTRNTFKFTVNPVDAEKCAYKVYAAGQTPSVEDIFATGTEISATEVSQHTYEGEPGDYFVAAAVQNKEVTALSEPLTFRLLAAESINFTVDRVVAKDYGYDVMIDIYDANYNYIKADVCYSDQSNKSLPGTYTLGAEDAESAVPGTIWYKYSNTKINDTELYFKSGTLTIEKNGADYTLKFNLIREDDKVLDIVWTGQIQWQQ